MCGIAFVMSKDGHDVRRTAVETYHSNRGRGTEGFGTVRIAPDGACQVLHSVNECMAVNDMLAEASPCMLVHNRLPTSTRNVPGQCHPFLVRHDELAFDWLVMHNGVVSNDDELEKAHAGLGYAYTSKTAPAYFNDSEALAVAFARFAEGVATDEVHGYGAVLAVKLSKAAPDGGRRALAVIAWRTDSGSLGMSDDGHTVRVWSEGPAKTVPADTFVIFDPADPAAPPELVPCTGKLIVPTVYKALSVSGNGWYGHGWHGKAVQPDGKWQATGAKAPKAPKAVRTLSAPSDAPDLDDESVVWDLMDTSDEMLGRWMDGSGGVWDTESGKKLFQRQLRGVGNGLKAWMTRTEYRKYAKRKYGTKGI